MPLRIAMVLVCALAAQVQAQPASIDVIALIDLYAQGRQDEAIARAAALPDLGPLRLRFVQDTPSWIAADPALAAGRRAAMAGFIVELMAARLESDWGRLSDLIEWTCVQLRAAGPPTPFERRWHMATTALAGRARARVWLLGPYARLPHQKPHTPQKDDPPSPKHLLHAFERFPDDPHFQLAQVNAWTWGRDAEPIRNLDGRIDRAATVRLQLEAITAFEPLTNVPVVAAEALIRTGQLHMAAENPAGALRAFEAAQPITSSRELTYLAHFLAGRALEALARPDDAATQYQRALEILPDAESATIALSSLQFLRTDRTPAVERIDRLFSRPANPTDPGRLVGYGFFLHWPAIKAALR
jgi:tetratricopeptide (TPR) repeat protein